MADPYKPRSNEDIFTLATDVVAGRVFGTWNLPAGERPENIFMPMGLMDMAAIKQLEINEIQHLYEYVEKAGPLAVNGYPCFMSMKVLSREETVRMKTAIDAIVQGQKDAKSKFIAGS